MASLTFMKPTNCFITKLLNLRVVHLVYGAINIGEHRVFDYGEEFSELQMILFRDLS